MPRVVLVTSQFPQPSETFLVSKFIGLLEKGWDVYMVCNQSQRAAWNHFPGLGNNRKARRRVRIAWPHRPLWMAAVLSPLALLRCLLWASAATLGYLRRGYQRFGVDIFRRLYLDAEIIRLQPDLVHFEFGTLAVQRMYIKELLGCKLLVSFRGYDLNFAGLDDPAYYAQVWQHADMLHLLGQDLWRRALRRGCSEDKPHALIPPAIDLDYFDFPGRQSGEVVGTPARPLRILSVGRLEWKKGYEYAFQAVGQLKDAGLSCEYRVVGDGEYFEALAFARHQLGLEGIVYFLGAQPRSMVKDSLAWADVFLHPSLSEGFCNAVIEAQAMQVPVVCSDAGGLVENVTHGETGFITPRRNPQVMASWLVQLAGDPTLRQRTGRAGRQHVVQQFKLADQITGFSTLYQQVIDLLLVSSDL